MAIKRKFGKLRGEPITEGSRIYNPLLSKYIKVPTRNINLEITLAIPSKEGLTIDTEVSILYRLDPKHIPQILREVGENFEQNLISPVFRSALADVSSRFMAKDMHTGQRAVIETAVKQQMMDIIGEKGFIVDAVLMKRVVLPESLSDAIEAKLAAEQEAQRMEFVLQRERQEADRRIIEAKGIRDAQLILAEGLTEPILRYQAIEAFKVLAQSSNAKVILTDGKSPMLVTP
jgi:regulator of protease activity HflC (stomatin/prohibitin superfamily)